MNERRDLRRLNRARWRLAATLTAAMMVVYVGFILLVAYAPRQLAATLAPGMSIGIVLGSSVIVTAWILMAIYVYWTNRHFDEAARVLRARE